ncbi:MAG: nickel pincer cofactor biosynthesis protein LarC [Candidatus Zixiibacteriota bacterium]
MKLLYFDCFSGISGDMILGALIDSGLPLDRLQHELAKLPVTGFSVSAEKAVKNGITGTKVTVHTDDQKAHRHLKQIMGIIEASSLSNSVKQTSIRVFETLAGAEAKIHDTTADKIHFHEVGALDAIVDIVGAIAAMELLGIDQVWSSAVHVGTGFVDCQHGRLPLPAPATVEILKGTPVYSTGLDAELVTPTGAAILKTMSAGFGPFPPMTLESVGYGAGSRDLPIPNLLRVLIGTSADDYEMDQVDLIEANIDNMPPEQFEYVVDKLMSSGALDAYLTPIIMKKSRPAITLSVIARPQDAPRLLDVVFAETTTLGVRLQKLERRKLKREVRTVVTKYGDVRVKLSWLSGRIRDITPEYDDCRRLAEEKSVPLREVFREAARVARGEWG